MGTLAEPFHYAFLQRALVEIVLVGIVSAAVGPLIVLRRLAFTGESIAETVLPGVVLAEAAGASLLGGAAAFALATVALIALIERDRRVVNDVAVGIALSGLFPLGVILLALQQSPSRSLQDYLFGDLLSIAPSDLVITAAIALAVAAIVTTRRRPLIAASFDRPFAEALGFRTGGTDLLALVLIAASVLVCLLAVGTVLAVALLVMPAATARLLTRRVGPMALVTGAVAIACGIAALELSYQIGIAASPAVVLCLAGVFLLAAAVSASRRLHLRSATA
jgi:manganese/iron transport system permease protein